MKLRYDKPANEWTDALPLGNGRVGAMVFGGTHTERFALNEDTLWSGVANSPGNNENALAVLPEARRAALEGRFDDANELCKQMQGAFGEAYMPLGDLFLFTDDTSEVSDYTRELDLDTAIATTRYRVGLVTYTREAFVSAPDQLMVVRISADVPGSISLTARFDSQLRHTVHAQQTRFLRMMGTAPTRSLPNYVTDDNPVEYGENGITFTALLHLQAHGGRVSATQRPGLRVHKSDAVTLHLSLATSFVDADNPTGRDPFVTTQEYLSALSFSYDELRERHIADHQALFRRVSLDLGAVESESDLPTVKRIRRFHETQDPALAALLFQYGRYLLITSSRPGTQPANLQGIWNAELRPPWSSNYTLNINAEMNYWLAETANLSECHEPLLRFVRELSVPGAVTARVHYGAEGWAAHHNSDLWRKTSPVAGEPMWANWAMGGAWLCRHLWEHFEFGGDENFLREIYPVMRGAATFCLHLLTEDNNGNLVTAPSTSPEHRFRTPGGKLSAVSVASTMDMEIMRDLFGNVESAARILNMDAALVSVLQGVRGQLFPRQIGSRGQLLEWFREFEDEDEHHRHVSHLYGLYPAALYTPASDPKLADAVRRSLEMRGDAGTGWSLGWKLCLWARLGDGNHAHALINRLLTLVDTSDTNYKGGGGVYANLFDAHPPFQIDGNFAFTAGVIEMLLQSYAREVHLLPALPDRWHAGSVAGLRARNGITVGIRWQNGKLISATFRADRDTTITVRYHSKTTQLTLPAGQLVAVIGDIF